MSHPASVSAGLELDERRQAMLKAMGVELWWQPRPLNPLKGEPKGVTAAALPQTAAGPVTPTPVAAEQAPVPAPATRQVEPVPAPEPTLAWTPAQPPSSAPAPRAPQIAAPQGAVQGLADAAPSWHLAPAQALYAAAGDSAAESAGGNWLLVVDDPAELGDDAEQARRLLDNMLRAMGLYGQSRIWCSWTRKAPADGLASVMATELIAQVTPAVVLVMGRASAQQLLQTREPLGVLRRARHQLGSLPVVVTYSPNYLLRAAHAKAGAWQDLQRAMALLGGSAAG
ncbi:hypothetical protein D8I35_14460 [Corticibacter populi]|uniref:Uracil-DNA glycosylase-like domain-containing protein n=1 Tax=Corticibacter populi TaxID=1550736 RepID=A0A3M6QPW8_9BURK|nr:uracil-DNA glycosylase family protein [Corticibacter populi]RMX05043.1 hypothetical protein D8I35_14460 [Corticibacter populi]RZS33519.1 DNA polymerase [Corticibacter populi]